MQLEHRKNTLFLLFDTNLTEEPFTTDNITIQEDIMSTAENGASAGAAQLDGTGIAPTNIERSHCTGGLIGGSGPQAGMFFEYANAYPYPKPFIDITRLHPHPQPPGYEISPNSIILRTDILKP